MKNKLKKLALIFLVVGFTCGTSMAKFGAGGWGYATPYDGTGVSSPTFSEINTNAPRLRIDADVYITGYSSATTYYGDGSNLTGVASLATQQQIQLDTTTLGLDLIALETIVTQVQLDTATLGLDLIVLEAIVTQVQLDTATLGLDLISLEAIVTQVQLDTATLDANKLNLSGDTPMAGNFDVGGYDIIESSQIFIDYRIILGSAGYTGDAIVFIMSDDTSKFVIQSTGAVNIRYGLSGTSMGGVADDFTIEGAGNVGMTIASPDGNTSNIYMASPSDNNGAIFRWQYSTALFSIGTSNPDGTVVIKAGNFADAVIVNTSSTNIKGNCVVDGTTNLQSTTTIYRALEENIYHVVGGTFGVTNVIPCTQNVWSKVTNATNDLWQGTEADGFSMISDSMVITNSGDYYGVWKIAYSATTGNDWVFRVRNLTQATVTYESEGTSTTGANNRVVDSTPYYFENTAGDIYIMECKNTSSSADLTVHSTKFIGIYLHE